MMEALTFEKLMKIKDLIKGPPNPKEEFFKRFLPKVEDCTDWVVLFPEHIKLPKGVGDFNWIKQSEYTSEIIAVNAGEFSSFYGIKQALS